MLKPVPSSKQFQAALQPRCCSGQSSLAQQQLVDPMGAMALLLQPGHLLDAADQGLIQGPIRILAVPAAWLMDGGVLDSLAHICATL